MTEVFLANSCLRTEDGRRLDLDVRRWVNPADVVDHLLMDRALAPVLDIGCGPGRHVRALLERGIEALGVEISPTAVALARRKGAEVLERSVFDPLPRHGEWGSALLLDGSIGIGGDPQALLVRAGQLLARRARILVETERPDEPSEVLYVCIETKDKESPWFWWSRLSLADVDDVAVMSGFRVTETWEEDGRFFAQLDR
jgi:SAM-dependent methyltransferase